MRRSILSLLAVAATAATVLLSFSTPSTAAAVDKARATAQLKAAIQKGDMTAFKAALSHGADVNGWNPNDPIDRLPLVEAVLDKKTAMVDALLAHGAKINGHTVNDPAYELKLPPGTAYFDPDHYGSPLTSAASQHNIPMMERLLRAGADINRHDLSGRNVFSAALMADNSDLRVFRFLLSHGYKPAREPWNSSIIDASFGGSPELIDMLLAHGAKVNKPGKNGMTALMSAACGHNGPVVALLIKRGAKVNARDKTGATALNFGTRSGPPVKNGPNDPNYAKQLAKYDLMMSTFTKAHAQR